jgi:hypothetical protein
MSVKINKAQCKICGDILESTDRHDFKYCSCGSVAVDGGHDYARRVGDPKNFIELSEFYPEIEVTINGIKLENTQCFNCGEDIDFREGELFVVHFDEGEPQTRNHPGSEAEIYIECMRCYKEGQK